MKYEQSTIYKLCCNDLNITEIYIGSTTNFNRRKSEHKKDCNSENKKSNYCVYQFIRSNGGFENWSMVEIERFDARDKKNLCRRERFWIEKEKAVLNSRRAYITEKEEKEWRTEYNQKNKEHIKNQIAEYRINNKEQIKEQTAEYRLKNQKKIKEQRTEKVTCNCGSIVRRDGLYIHKKSKKHQTLIEQL